MSQQQSRQKWSRWAKLIHYQSSFGNNLIHQLISLKCLLTANISTKPSIFQQKLIVIETLTWETKITSNFLQTLRNFPRALRLNHSLAQPCLQEIALATLLLMLLLAALSTDAAPLSAVSSQPAPERDPLQTSESRIVGKYVRPLRKGHYRRGPLRKTGSKGRKGPLTKKKL